jgi:predicted nucleotidyltransferase component of viral defense system
MIERQEILSVASELSLSPEVIEKDYVLGWILAGVYADPELAPAWVFKGGTCLKKCFFETYRFSEDLDFTIGDAGHLEANLLRERFARISGWIRDASGVEIPEEQLRFDVYRNPREGLSCQGRLYYRGPLGRGGDLPRIKLDLTVDEVLVRPAVERSVGHPYSDLPSEGLVARCYSFAEIFAEKTRALGERSRPRDLYDVVNLHRLADDTRPPASEVLAILREKCRFKGIELPTMAALARAEAELRADWEGMLRHQLQALPPFESYWDALPAVFEWLSTGATPPRPRAAPLESGERVLHVALGRLGSAGIGRARELEQLRFAAASRLCVDLGYTGSVRRIEPYSLRRSAEGAVLLMAVRADSGESRSYRVDLIESVAVSNQPFVPRYEVELASAELAVRPISRQAVSGIGPSPFSLPRPQRPQRPRRTPWGSTGPTYVIECPLCRKKFNRTTYDTSLNAHKMPTGMPCPGRIGFLVKTRP